MRLPDFGRELARPFEVDERCFDCAELYHGCYARPESPDTRCADYLRLPDVKPDLRTDDPAVEDAGAHGATYPLGGRRPCAGPGAAGESAGQSARILGPAQGPAVRLWSDPAQGQAAL